MKLVENNVCAPKGFSALGKIVGIKKSGKMDFAVLFSDVPADAAAVYTSNKVKGAPLIVTKEHLQDGKAQAIVVNSGIANVCTGKKGIEDAREIAASAVGFVARPADRLAFQLRNAILQLHNSRSLVFRDSY